MTPEVRRFLKEGLGRHREHGQILRGLVIVSLFVGVAKVVGGFREMAVAARFGVSPAIDAYVLLQNLIVWPVGVWCSVTIAVLIPILIKADLADRDGASRFRRELFGVTVAFGLVAGIAVSAVLWLGADRGWFEAAPSVAAQAIRQALPLGATVPFGLAYGLLAAFLMASRSYANSLLDGVPAIVILVCVLAAAAGDVSVLVWATLVGAAFQVALTAFAQPGGARAILPSLSIRSPLWPGVLRSAGLVALGQVVMGASVVVDQLAAAKLGAGANATLGYATRLTALLVSLGAVSISRATLPVFSRMDHAADRGAVVYRWTWVLFLAGGGAALAGWFGAPVVVRLLYQHGQFNANNSTTVARVFQYSLVQIPFYFAGMVMVQLLAGAQRYGTFLAMGCLNLATKVASITWLAPRLGVSGIVLSTGIMYMFSFVFLLAFSRRHLKSNLSETA